MTTLTFKQLNTILELLQAERRVHNSTTHFHDGIVKDSLKGNPEKLTFLVDQQDANYKRKGDLDHTFYAVKELIDNFK